MSEEIDLGFGVFGLWRPDGMFLWKHPACRSWAEVRFGGPHHTLDSRDPLTMSPSLLCPMGCGTHGYIKQGRWVPA